MKSRFFGVLMEPWMHTSLEKIAQENKVSVAEVVRNAITPVVREYREKHGN